MEYTVWFGAYRRTFSADCETEMEARQLAQNMAMKFGASWFAGKGVHESYECDGKKAVRRPD